MSRYLMVAILGVVGCVDEDPASVAERSTSVEHGWDPGGVFHDGTIGVTDIECAMCTGEDSCATACVEGNGDPSTCGAAGPTCSAARGNVARAPLATAVASSTYSTGAAPAGAINGDRRGLDWANGGGWSDATNNVYPDSLEVRFYSGVAQPISEIDVYTLQDACGMSPSPSNCLEPTDTMTFANFGITDFRVQTWNGSAFVDAAAIAGNLNVKRRFELSPPVMTSKVRVVVDGARGNFSRIVEVEAWVERSAFDPYLAQALNNRIAMSGATGCETTPHATTLGGVTGVYKRCNYAWVVASPGNGAWLLPQSHVSNRYLGGSVWPASPTPMMTSLGFPKGAYHGSDASDSYVVFERGILAKSNTADQARRIGGLDATTARGPLWAEANAALTAAWLDARFSNKYPVTDSVAWACAGSTCSYSANLANHGFRFETEPNAFGYTSTFLMKYGASAAFHIDGEIKNKWWAASAGDLAALGWPIANEQRIAANGSAISQFTGGLIVWRPTSCNSSTFAATILTSNQDQPTPLHSDGLTGLTCDEAVQPCVAGAAIPFTSGAITGTYQFKCGDELGLPDRLSFQWIEAGVPVSYLVRAPILRRYLSTQPIGTSGDPISVDAAIATGLGLPESNAYTMQDATHQRFARGEIIDAESCQSACTVTTGCGRSCTSGAQRITCGEFKPPGFANGKCQLVDTYCEMPELMDLRVRDAQEIAHAPGGPEAFFYYRRAGHSEKRGSMPVQLGGVGGAPVSDYLAVWKQAIGDIESRPAKFPFASNLPGRSFVDKDRLQLEFTANWWSAPEIARAHAVVAGKQCITVPHTTYGQNPPIPAFPASSLHHVYEDDECISSFCNPDDYVGSIRLYHGDCVAQHWSQGRAFGFTAPRTLTNEEPAASPDLGTEDNEGAVIIDQAHFRTWCYSGRNLQRAGAGLLDTFEYGIGSQQHSGFDEL